MRTSSLARATLLSLVVITLAACPGNGTGDASDVTADVNAMDAVDGASAPDVNDASDIGTLDASCESAARSGSCNAGDMCNLTTTCTLCGHDLYTPWAPTCTCASGHWLCGIIDCFGPRTGVFTDPACTVPSVSDAGVDAQTTDGCGSADVVSITPEAGACPLNTTLCGSACVDLRSDPHNCGSCNNTCFAGQACSNGVCGCECPAGLTSCMIGCDPCVCIDLATDPTHCGSCGTQCAAGQHCGAGLCVSDDAGHD